MQLIVYNYKDLSRIFTIFGTYILPLVLPTFNPIEACVSELEWLLCLYEKNKKKKQIIIIIWCFVQKINVIITHKCDISNYLKDYKTDRVCWS